MRLHRGGQGIISSMKIAIVADWLTTYAGSERVLEQIIQCFPQADLFAVVDFLPEQSRSFLQGKRPTTTFIQKLPGAKRHYQRYLPFMPFAIEQLDLSGYDIILSSSHAVAKGIIVGPDQLHISYVHSPIRYAWDLQHQYLRESGLGLKWYGWFARWFLHYIRMWDVRTTNGVDAFIANSWFIARRIHRVYGRDATVIYPPVDINAFLMSEHKEDFYLTASRMVPYKRIDLIVEVFARLPEKRLVVIGDGPDLEKIRAKATSNIQMMGYQTAEVLRDYMQRAKAFVFAAEEDFGITTVEAQACGTPVIAFAKGGALETVIGFDQESDSPTGVFFDTQTSQAIEVAINRFEENQYRFVPSLIRQHAEQFSVARFRGEYIAFVEAAVKRWRCDLKGRA